MRSSSSATARSPIFRTLGEDGFRRIERELAAELADRDRLVISTGGRLMLDPQNVANLSRNGRVFCLVATPDEIFDRVTHDPSPTERPLLSVPDPRQRIVELLAERSPDYRRFAQLTTDAVSTDAVAADLAALATSDPHRFAIDNPSGGYEFSVGAAVLPFVRQLARIEGPMVVVTNAEVGELYLASCGDVDLTVTLPVGVDVRRTWQRCNTCMTRCSTPTSTDRPRSCRSATRSSAMWPGSPRRPTSVVSTSCTARRT